MSAILKFNASSEDGDLLKRSKHCCDGINKTIHIVANEPTLGLYRIQQHVRKTLPKLSECNNGLLSSKTELDGMIYDTKAAIAVAKEISDTKESFNNIGKLLKKASSAAALINMKHHPPVDLISL